MAKASGSRKNLPPTGEGKKQSPFSGDENKLSKRSEVAQAQRNHPEENYGTIAEEEGQAQSGDQQKKPTRPKAGR